MSNFVEKKKEIDFIGAALWGAVTFVRMHCDKKITVKDVVISFKKYFNIDDDNFQNEVGAVVYYRTNENVKKIIDKDTIVTMTPYEKFQFAMILLNEIKIQNVK